MKKKVVKKKKPVFADWERERVLGRVAKEFKLATEGWTLEAIAGFLKELQLALDDAEVDF